MACALAASGMTAGAARAAVGDEFVDGCMNTTPAKPNCTVTAGISGAAAEALSPDGNQLYVATAGNAGSEPASILTFDRNPSTGQLTRRTGGSCVTQTGSSGNCITAANLKNPQDIAFSPDGSTMYVSNLDSSTIIELHRTSDGTLSLMSQCIGSAGCTAATAMGAPYSLAVSPDGAALYARTNLGGGGVGLGSLLVFTRNADGTLTQKPGASGCWVEGGGGGCSNASGISQQGWQMVVTDSNVYTVGHNDFYIATITAGCGLFCITTQAATGSVAIFGRKADGTLTQAAIPNGCISNTGQSGGLGIGTGNAPVRCAVGSPALDQARTVTMSRDGKTVYVAGDNGLIGYSRNASTGALTQPQCLQKPGAGYAGCTDSSALGGVYRMAMTPDGSDLIVGSTAFNGFDFLQRDPASGQLTQRATTKRCISADGSGGACDTLGVFGGFENAAVSSDSRYVYLIANGPGAIVTMHRDFAPTCDSKSVDVPYQTSVAVPLTCTDVNGDTLSLAISSQPTNGTLGGGGTIDTSTGTVRYNPPLGYSGPDSFTYTATGKGVTSAPATVTLNVGAPTTQPAPPPVSSNVLPASLPTRINAVLGFAFSSSTSKQTKFTRLTVAGVPSGSTVTVTCIKGTCPSLLVTKKKVGKKTKLVSKPYVIKNASGTVKLSKVISKPLKASTQLQIVVTRPGMVGAVKVMTVGKRKAPKVATKCMQPGATKPGAC